MRSTKSSKERNDLFSAYEKIKKTVSSEQTNKQTETMKNLNFCLIYLKDWFGALFPKKEHPNVRRN